LRALRPTYPLRCPSKAPKNLLEKNLDQSPTAHQPVAVDRAQHRDLQLKLPVTDWSVASGLNSIFVAVTEFGDASRDLPIVFVNAGQDEAGKTLVAPIAVLGLHPGENLFLEGHLAWPLHAGGAAHLSLLHRPHRRQAVRDLRGHGLARGRPPAVAKPSSTPDGTASPLLEAAQKQLEVVETEIQRTKLMCQRLAELDVLRDMRFDATFPDGRTHTIDGFLTVDEARMKELPDAVILDLYRSGMLSVIHAHWVSLGNMRTLVDWYVLAHPAPVPVTA
jgi:hypothetical protein